MKDYLSISNKEISYIKNSIDRQRSFVLSIDAIKIIAFTTIINIDDDEIYLTFVDFKGRTYHINSYFLTPAFLDLLEKKFSYKYDASNIPFANFLNRKSCIVFPETLKGQPLFYKTKENIRAFFLMLARTVLIAHPASGIIRNEALVDISKIH